MEISEFIDTYSDDLIFLLAACRTEVLRRNVDDGFLVLPSFAEAFLRRDRRCGLRGPRQAGLRANIRLMFQAIVTRLHSPRAFSSPRSEN